MNDPAQEPTASATPNAPAIARTGFSFLAVLMTSRYNLVHALRFMSGGRHSEWSIHRLMPRLLKRVLGSSVGTLPSAALVHEFWRSYPYVVGCAVPGDR
jgi:hypothetical protein